jgi:hypothetical protein
MPRTKKLVKKSEVLPESTPLPVVAEEKAEETQTPSQESTEDVEYVDLAIPPAPVSTPEGDTLNIPSSTPEDPAHDAWQFKNGYKYVKLCASDVDYLTRTMQETAVSVAFQGAVLTFSLIELHRLLRVLLAKFLSNF